MADIGLRRLIQHARILVDWLTCPITFIFTSLLPCYL